MSLPPDFIQELTTRLQGDVRADIASRILYSTDASIYQIEPLGVAYPRTLDDLQAAVELAARYKIPVVARGAGTGLAGQAIGKALILDCSRWLNAILEINPEERTATVEPGVVLARLNRMAARYGLMFGPDPASAERATMGGVIANNATGAHSLSYGMTADHLLSAEVVMSDGSLAVLGEQISLDNTLISALHAAALDIREKYASLITQHWPRTWRNSAGYRLNYLLPWSPSIPSQWSATYYPANLSPGTLNLAPLLAGSEGTLAVICRATVNLVPKPRHTILAVLAYQSNAEACDDVPRLLLHHPSAVELVPRMLIRLARSVPAYARQMDWVIGDPAALLVVEFSGDDPAALKQAARSVGDVVAIAESTEEQARVWNVRKVGLGLLDSRPQSARPVAFIEDCAIPVQRLGKFVREVERILSAHDVEGAMYAHASAGCLHIRPILDLKTQRGVTALRSISQAVHDVTMRLGGAMSSEHGDGLARSEFLEQTYGPDLMDAMRRLKNAADPQGILNPGKIIDAPKMDDNLRYGAEYRTQLWETELSFARHGGLDVAIEQCNGQGSCLKDTGVMCPSYQATRDEMHSTRGRANLLRSLIRQQPTTPASSFTALPLRGFTSEKVEATAAALDLCLACKGCKAECPSRVDMAKLKSAFQHEYYKTHRRQLRDYMFGYFHVAAGFAASVAPLMNALMAMPAIRNLVARVFGITPHRPFPRFAPQRAKLPAARNIPVRDASPGQGHQEEDARVILLSDPFSRFIEPATEQAALDILSACGFEVEILPIVGAGAAFLSKGFIPQARKHAAQVLNACSRIDPTGEVAVVGLEPPEIYAMKNDYVDLLPARAQEILQRQDRVFLLDEFLIRSKRFSGLCREGMLQPRKESDGLRVAFHPHCHQRAEGPASDGFPNGVYATVELLRSCGYDVELLDTGCCGIAGTFGYEAEHFELSMKVGELRLFPLIRESQAEQSAPATQRTKIASTGAACRLQIQQGTAADAVHPIVLVANVIRSWRLNEQRE